MRRHAVGRALRHGPRRVSWARAADRAHLSRGRRDTHQDREEPVMPGPESGGTDVSTPAARARRPAARSPRDAREGSRHLADVDVGAGRRRSAGARLRPRGAGIQARHAPGDHWRQPAAAVLVDDRGTGAGRRGGADVPGRARRGIRLCAQQCGDRLRGGRGPGAGRQDARGDRAGTDLEAYLL